MALAWPLFGQDSDAYTFWDMLYHLKTGLMTIVRQRLLLPEGDPEFGDLAGACHFSRHLWRVLADVLPPLLQIGLVRESSYLS